jgi:hypothetical protein
MIVKSVVTVSHGAGAAPQATYEANAGGYERSWDLILTALEAAGLH